MDLTTAFSITVHAKEIHNGISGTIPLKLQFSNIAMRNPIETEAEKIQENKEKKTPLTRIHLVNPMRAYSSGGDSMKMNIDVLETNEEIDALIDEAMEAHIQKLQKMRVTIL